MSLQFFHWQPQVVFFSFHIGEHMILAPHHSNMLNLPLLFTTRKQHPNIDIWKWHRFPQISSTPLNWTLWGSKVYSNPFYMSNHHFPLLNIAYLSNGSWFLAWRICFLEKWFRKMPLDRNLLGGWVQTGVMLQVQVVPIVPKGKSISNSV